MEGEGKFHGMIGETLLCFFIPMIHFLYKRWALLELDFCVDSVHLKR